MLKFSVTISVSNMIITFSYRVHTLEESFLFSCLSCHAFEVVLQGSAVIHVAMA